MMTEEGLISGGLGMAECAIFVTCVAILIASLVKLFLYLLHKMA